MLEGGKTPLCSKQELENMGYKMIAYPVTTIFTAAYAIKNALTHLRNNGDTRGVNMTSFQDYKNLVELDKYL